MLDQVWVIRPEVKDRVLALLKRALAGDKKLDTMEKLRKALGSGLVSVIEGEIL